MIAELLEAGGILSSDFLELGRMNKEDASVCLGCCRRTLEPRELETTKIYKSWFCRLEVHHLDANRLPVWGKSASSYLLPTSAHSRRAEGSLWGMNLTHEVTPFMTLITFKYTEGPPQKIIAPGDEDFTIGILRGYEHLVLGRRLSVHLSIRLSIRACIICAHAVPSAEIFRCR